MAWQHADDERLCPLDRRMAEAETWIVPTLIVSLWLLPEERQHEMDGRPGWTSCVWPEWHDMAEVRRSFPLAGADFEPAGFTLSWELTEMVDAGLSPWGALLTATRNPARFLGEEDRWGTVTEGKLGNLVLLEDDPLVDIGRIRSVAAVVVDGRLVEAHELRAIEEAACGAGCIVDGSAGRPSSSSSDGSSSGPLGVAPGCAQL